MQVQSKRVDYPVTPESIDAARRARDQERADLYRDTGLLVLGDEGVIRAFPRAEALADRGVQPSALENR